MNITTGEGAEKSGERGGTKQNFGDDRRQSEWQAEKREKREQC